MSNSQEKNETKEAKYDPAPALQVWEESNTNGVVTAAIIKDTQFALNYQYSSQAISSQEYEDSLDKLSRADYSHLTSAEDARAVIKAKDGLDTIIRKVKFESALKVLTQTPDKAHHGHVGQAIYNGVDMLRRGVYTQEQMQNYFAQMHAAPLPETLGSFRNNMMKSFAPDVGYDVNANVANGDVYKYN